jgi:hypothetical protein
LEKIAPLKRGENPLSLSLCDIFVLSPKDLWELQVSETLGAPSFMRIDERRWCQASVQKRREKILPLFSLAGKLGNRDWGQNKK